MRNRLALISVVVLALTGSACAAKYEVKTTAIQAPAALAVTGTSEAAFEADWWRQFRDAELDRLVELALAENRDLEAAAARYTAARELAGAASLLHLPTGGVSIGASRQHLSVTEAGGDRPGRTSSVVQSGVGVAWEADVFGRLRAIGRAAAADAGVSAMDVRGAQVAIAAQVAAGYFELRGAERDVSLIDGLLDRTQAMLDTMLQLVAAGRGTKLDLLRAQQVEDELMVALSMAQHRVERARNRIATLTGQVRDTLQVGDSPSTPLQVTTLPIGAPADLLRRRPDVVAAEFRVTAAAARTRVARADLFPRVSATGAIGLVAGSVGRLGEAAAGSWLVAPALVWNVLDLPRVRREVRAAGAMADAAFADYEQAVLLALEESRTALDAYASASRELAAQERRAAAAAEAADVVAIQYREGLVDSLARTEAERDAIAGALAANQALTSHRLAVVDVYRTLGGGWR